MKFTLEVSPLSVNKAWKGRRFKTGDYLQFERDVCAVLPISDEEPMEGELVVEYIYYIKNYGNTDTGNLEKTLTDMLVKRRYIKDDRYIKKLIQTKEKLDGEYEYVDILISRVAETAH